MRKPHLILWALLAVTALAGLCSVVAQEVSSTGVPVHMVVTVEPRHGSNVPVLNREDVMVYQGRDRAKVTDWIPLQGEHAGLQLFILIDDADNTSLGSQLEAIRQFINTQPSTTAIGVATGGSHDLAPISHKRNVGNKLQISNKCMTIADRLSTYALAVFKLNRRNDLGEQFARRYQPLDLQYRVTKGNPHEKLIERLEELSQPALVHEEGTGDRGHGYDGCCAAHQWFIELG